MRAGKRRAAASRPARRFEHGIVHVPPAQPSRMRDHRLWGGLMRACGGRGAAASWPRALRALEHRELHVKRCESREAASRRRSEH